MGSGPFAEDYLGLRMNGWNLIDSQTHKEMQDILAKRRAEWNVAVRGMDYEEPMQGPAAGLLQSPSQLAPRFPGMPETIDPMNVGEFLGNPEAYVMQKEFGVSGLFRQLPGTAPQARAEGGGELPFKIPETFTEDVTGTNVSRSGVPQGPNAELNIAGIRTRVIFNERNNSFWVELLRTEGDPSIGSLRTLKSFIEDLSSENPGIGFKIMAHDAKRARVYERAGFTVESVMEGGTAAGTGRPLTEEESAVILSMPPKEQQ